MQSLRCSQLVFLLILTANFWGQGLLSRDIFYEPSSAGVHYPRESKDLRGQVESFMSQAHRSRADEYPSLIFVPGGAYLFTGGIMADAYIQVMGKVYDAVIVIAPKSDHSTKSGVSIFPGVSYRSMQGLLQANERVVSSILAQQNPIIELSRDGFNRNHYIDVQLPFIQYVFGNRDIVTLSVGMLSPSEIQDVASSLVGAIGNLDVLFIVATNGRQVESLDERNQYSRALCVNIFGSSPFYAKNNEIPQIDEVVLDLGISIANKLEATSPEIYRVSSTPGLNIGREKHEAYFSAGYYKSSSEEDMTEIRLSDSDVKYIADFVMSSLEARFSDGGQIIYLPPFIASYGYGVYVKVSKDDDVIASGAELFTSQPLVNSINSVLDYIATANPVTGSLTREQLEGATIDIVITSRGCNFLPGDDFPDRGLVFLKYHNHSSLNLIERSYDGGQKAFRDLCLRAGLLFDCWKDDAAEIHTFSTVPIRRKFR